MRNKGKIVALFTALSLFTAACSMPGEMQGMGGKGNQEHNASAIELKGEKPAEAKKSGDTFELMAKKSSLETANGEKWPTWSYNGSSPGPTIRVKEGEMVRVRLKNTLPEPVTIHWHGLPVPNRMDGVPGVTQNSVEPGKTFTYEFKATVPGTYWYHSHQKSADQVERGLYGTVIVDPKKAEKVDRDYTLVLDEWNRPGKKGGHGEMGHGGVMNHHMDYDVFTINGGTYPNVPPIEVNRGDRVKLRLVNAGYQTHHIHVHGHDVKVTHMDGQPVNQPPSFRDQLIPVSPGERYEVELIANNPGNHIVESHDSESAAAGMKVPIRYQGVSRDGVDTAAGQMQLPVLNTARYGKEQRGGFKVDDSFDEEIKADLGEGMDHPNMKMVYTINGKTFDESEPFQVKKGDKVKLRTENTGRQNHPMHLHGHFFQVIRKNGKPVNSMPMKDTLNVRPGESYEIAFEADNPGDWMFHCHDLHHAADGMATLLKYKGYKSFKPDPNAPNEPE